MLYIKSIRTGGNSFTFAFNKSFARTRGWQEIQIPRHGLAKNGGTQEYSLEMFSEAELKNYPIRIKGVVKGGQYYRMLVELPTDAPIGEYSFRFSDRGKVLEEGIAVVEGCPVKIKENQIKQSYEQNENC